MSFNPQTFGKLNSFVGVQACEGSRFVHVPVRRILQANVAAGAVAFSDQLDLSSFLQGNPAPYVSGFQTLIAIHNPKDANGNLVNNSFLTELVFNNGFKCIVPGKSYTTLSIVADNAPVIDLKVYSISAASAGLPVEIDLYFGNSAMDQITFLAE